MGLAGKLPRKSWTIGEGSIVESVANEKLAKEKKHRKQKQEEQEHTAFFFPLSSVRHKTPDDSSKQKSFPASKGLKSRSLDIPGLFVAFGLLVIWSFLSFVCGKKLASCLEKRVDLLFCGERREEWREVCCFALVVAFCLRCFQFGGWLCSGGCEASLQ